MSNLYVERRDEAAGHQSINKITEGVTRSPRLTGYVKIYICFTAEVIVWKYRNVHNVEKKWFFGDKCHHFQDLIFIHARIIVKASNRQ
jgi:hypothetical protein